MGKSDFIFRYRVRNWPEYNRALVHRGSLTLWVDEQAVQTWRNANGSGTRGGRPRIYADTAIEGIVTLTGYRAHCSHEQTQIAVPRSSFSA